MSSLVVHDDLDRSASPPGREGREEWRSTEPAANEDAEKRNGRRSPLDEKRRSRSRSPLRRRRSSPSKEMRYAREGTNTTSREPHMERARLFVGNIEPNRTHRRDLIKLFSNYGEVLGVSIHKGYAFVQMDRERTANKAINYEDNRNFMGNRIHVEFSQAALKAGAKFERLPLNNSPPPPAQHHRDRYPQPSASDAYYYDDHERQREERLSRILQMEREIAMLRSQDTGSYGSDSRKPRVSSEMSHDSYDRRGDGGGYHNRRSPGGVGLNSHGGYDSYSSSRDRDLAYRGGERGGGGGGGPIGGGGGGGGGSGRGIYSRLSPPPGDHHHHHTRGSGGSGDSSYRESVSYPTQFGSGGSSYGSRNAPAVVGYGSQGGKGSGSLPPGWPSSDHHEKANANRPPFTNTGPWS